MFNDPKSSIPSFLDTQWLSVPEGQLAIDVIESPTHLIVRSAIAGIRAEDLEVTLTEDTLTIRGSRHHDAKQFHNEQVHLQECHWGNFSRSVILPAHVDPDHVEAQFKRGILTITMKKTDTDHRVSILDLGDL